MEEHKLIVLENRILTTVFGLRGIKFHNELLIGFAVQTLLGQRSG